mgnify:CR=1 FL=1
MAYSSVQGTLPAATPTPVFVCPAGKTVSVMSVRVNNPAAFTFTVSKHDAASSTTLQIYTVNLSAGDILTDGTMMYLKEGDYLELTSDIANTNYIILVVEF